MNEYFIVGFKVQEINMALRRKYVLIGEGIDKRMQSLADLHYCHSVGRVTALVFKETSWSINMSSKVFEVMINDPDLIRVSQVFLFNRHFLDINHDWTHFEENLVKYHDTYCQIQ